MVKSGVIFGVVALVLVLGFSVLLTPFCAPCIGLFLGLGAGYVAGVFDKPINSTESIKKGAIAGAITGGIGFVGGLVAAIINASIMTPAMIQSFSRIFGLTNYSVNQSQIWTYQLIYAILVGVFDIVLMGILGVTGGALWYQIIGKNQPTTIIPPQEPIPPSY